MKTMVFATNNPNKVREVQEILGDRFRIRSLEDIGCLETLPETSATIEGNALQKARYVYRHFGTDCFAEDTGLEVRALNNEPGVFSARYAGPQRNSDDTMELLLKNPQGKKDRYARFKTVIALIRGGREYTFEGIAEGRVLEEKRGNEGFGYDPVFAPEGSDLSFAEMTPAEKNAVSHRGKAMRRLIEFLQGAGD